MRAAPWEEAGHLVGDASACLAVSIRGFPISPAFHFSRSHVERARHLIENLRGAISLKLDRKPARAGCTGSHHGW